MNERGYASWGAYAADRERAAAARAGAGGRGKLSLVAKAKRFVLSSFFLRRTKAHARASRSNEKEHRLYYRVKDCGLRLSPPLPSSQPCPPANPPAASLPDDPIARSP